MKKKRLSKSLSRSSGALSGHVVNKPCKRFFAWVDIDIKTTIQNIHFDPSVRKSDLPDVFFPSIRFQPSLFLLFNVVTAQITEESNEFIPAVLPPSIVNRFNEVNNDGSYKFGYEASDGTFKTESKDDQGNVVGTYVARSIRRSA